jgi:hypothetical protein
LLAGKEEEEEAPRRDAALPVVWREVLWRSAGVAGVGGKQRFRKFSKSQKPESES